MGIKLVKRQEGFLGGNVRCGGQCLGKSSEVGKEGIDIRIIERGFVDWLDVGCEGARGVQDGFQFFVLGEQVDVGIVI